MLPTRRPGILLGIMHLKMTSNKPSNTMMTGATITKNYPVNASMTGINMLTEARWTGIKKETIMKYLTTKQAAEIIAKRSGYAISVRQVQNEIKAGYIK